MTELRVVVGSGPSSIGVTHALLERGFHVLMLDVGQTLDEETAKVVAAMARQEPGQWSSADKAIIQRADFNSDQALSPKRAFGSSYAYYMDPMIDAPPGMRLYGSRAFGGLSTVWGCALLKATVGDMAGWPTEVSRGIEAAYAQIGQLVGQSTRADIFMADTHLKISAAARTMLGRYQRAPDRERDIDVYPTPLAIDRGCKACNSCMYGCVYGYTYGSLSSIETVFMNNPRFRYLGGVTVERYRETTDGVEITTVQGPDRRTEVLNAKQLFLAAGMMSSLRIVWNSSAEVARVLRVSDSSYFVIPGFIPSWHGLGRTNYHGLSHLSVDLKMPPFEQKFAHVQLYFNNPAVADGLNASLGAFAIKPVRELVGLANKFLIAGQGYLHSDFCHHLKFECDTAGIIHASVEHNPDTAKAIDIALSQFERKMRNLGAIFLKGGAKVIAYGASKTAGAIPHATVARPTTTDLLGRPFGAQNVFLVDGTVMPAVPARNHTLTMMANALRIGQLA